MNRRLRIAAVFVFASALVGCASTRKTTGDAPKSPSEMEVIHPLSTENSLASASGDASGEDRIRRTDVFEIGAAPVLTAKLAGGLFAASTRAAIPAQRPTAVVRVHRSRHVAAEPGYGNAERYSIEIDQRPGGKVVLTEEHAGELLSAIEEPLEAANGSKLVGSEIRFADLKLIRSADAPDVVTIESPTATVTYDRAGLAEQLRKAAQTIDGFRNPRPANR